MGYTTEFEGSFTIDPPLDPKLVIEVNEYCGERHGGSNNISHDCPSFWCDWNISQDGKTMSWNGSEKSYEMLEWARKLWSKFFTDHELLGMIKARGEDFDDVWAMVANGKTISKVSGWK